MPPHAFCLGKASKDVINDEMKQVALIVMFIQLITEELCKRYSSYL